MKLLADEDVDFEVVERLRVEGHEVAYIAELQPGSPDFEVLAKARELNAILVTQDKDFGDLVFRQGLLTRGVVLLRLAGLPATEKCFIVAAVLQEHHEKLVGSFTVVSAVNVRIRRF